MKILLILTALLLCGCAGQRSVQGDAGQNFDAVPDEKARIVFFRSKDSALYIVRKAAISIDEQKIGGVGYGTFQYHDVDAGERLLRADMWDMPGQCELIVNATAGEVYYFQVDPRAESFGAFAAGDTAALLLSGNSIVSVVGGVGAVAAESYGQQCGGAFRLYPVDAATATSRLASLKHSD